MVRAFDWMRADFSRMTERPPAEVPVAVADVAHCAAVDVSEQGTEAAAATAMTFLVGGVAPDFIVDRPFLFLVADETTEAILFEGKIADPR